VVVPAAQYVLDSQLQRLTHPEPAAVEQINNQTGRDGRTVEQRLAEGAHLLPRWCDALVNRLLGPQGVDVAERFPQHLAVEKPQGGQSLVLGASGDLLFEGQIGQESLGFALGWPGVGQVKAEVIKAAGPVTIGLLGAEREVPQPDLRLDQL
jgi:hypothetical protein